MLLRETEVRRGETLGVRLERLGRDLDGQLRRGPPRVSLSSLGGRCCSCQGKNLEPRHNRGIPAPDLERAALDPAPIPGLLRVALPTPSPSALELRNIYEAPSGLCDVYQDDDGRTYLVSLCAGSAWSRVGIVMTEEEVAEFRARPGLVEELGLRLCKDFEPYRERAIPAAVREAIIASGH